MAKTVKGKVNIPGKGMTMMDVHLVERPIAGEYGRVKLNGKWQDVTHFGRNGPNSWWG